MSGRSSKQRGGKQNGYRGGRGRGEPTNNKSPPVTGPKKTNNPPPPNRAPLVKPKWPSSITGNIESFWQVFKAYRETHRKNLIRDGLLDDPDKPKKLSEAIDFKGTCEEMCPEYEQATRIHDHSVWPPEHEVGPNGSLRPCRSKMVKANARSAAGQDAPLPEDVRSPAALRRTVNYLFDKVLGYDTDNLPAVHGFLWDRTRAIRTDFTRQISSLDASGMLDYVYCLERITRFHVVALHQLSTSGMYCKDFTEQQEVEQLGKTLLSLVETYKDCEIQNIPCENEAEFRAYFVLFNKDDPSVLEAVQDMGFGFWGKSEDIKIAVSLVEMLQNTWDNRGPLNPHSATDMAENAFSRYFSVVEDKRVSYTMACFAEIHFNTVRKSVLKTILASYRKQRGQTKEWTLSELNKYLRFDDENDIIDFGNSYGVQFGELDGQEYLSFEGDVSVEDPFPRLKQNHSRGLVERKRGSRSLPTVIESTVYDEGDGSEEDDGLFMKDDNAGIRTVLSALNYHAPARRTDEDNLVPQASGTLGGQVNPTPVEHTGTPASIFGQPAQKGFGGLFSNPFAPKPVAEVPQKPPPFDFQAAQQVPKAPVQAPVTIKFAPAEATKVPSQTPFNFRTSTQSLETPAPVPPFNFTTSQQSAQATAQLPAPFNFAAPQEPAQATPTGSAACAPSFAAATSSQALSQSAFVQPVETTLAPSAPQRRAVEEATEAIAQHGKTVTIGFDTTPRVPATSAAALLLNAPISGILNQAPSTPQPSPGSQISPHSDVTEKFRLPTPSNTPTFGDSLPMGIVLNETPSTQQKVIEMAARFDKFVDWYVSGDGGIMDQFIEWGVDQIVNLEIQKFERDEATQRLKEAEEAARKQADDYRRYFLSSKYLRFWRESAHRMWMKRKGRAARKAREEMAKRTIAERAAASASVVEDFRASTRSRRSSLESLLDATGVLKGVYDSDGKIRAIASDRVKKRKKQRPQSNQSNSSSKPRDDPLRRSMLSDKSYLSGESRIFHMKNPGAMESKKQVSGVQTDYFRLKARGITRILDRTPTPPRERSVWTTPTPTPTPSFQAFSNANQRKRSIDDVDDGDDNDELLLRSKRLRERMDRELEEDKLLFGDDFLTKEWEG